MRDAASTVDWTGLRTKTREQLSALGMRAFDERLMLFPYAWYADIPAGYEVETINGTIIVFEPGKTDNDQRYGCLAYGVPAGDF